MLVKFTNYSGRTLTISGDGDAETAYDREYVAESLKFKHGETLKMAKYKGYYLDDGFADPTYIKVKGSTAVIIENASITNKNYQLNKRDFAFGGYKISGKAVKYDKNYVAFPVDPMPKMPYDYEEGHIDFDGDSGSSTAKYVTCLIFMILLLVLLAIIAICQFSQAVCCIRKH
jgi:hypothetical protein